MFALGCIQAMKCNKNTCPTGITTHDKNLQRGLVVTDKAERVARYQQGMEKEVAVIAHSCGAAEPRLLRRNHCRIVQFNGQTALLSEMFPDVALPDAEACPEQRSRGSGLSPDVLSLPAGSSAAGRCGRGGAACAAPWPRSGGCARG